MGLIIVGMLSYTLVSGDAFQRPNYTGWVLLLTCGLTQVKYVSFSVLQVILLYQHQKVILGAAIMVQDHTSQYIEQTFTEMSNEWNLICKIFLVLRNSVTNMACAMRTGN